jgi:hypothetical protein
MFDVSEVEFDAVGQLMVEMFENDDDTLREIALAVRTDPWDVWSPPTEGQEVPG